MKYLIKSTIILLFSLVSIQSFAMDPKLKILAESAGYGTVAGALLGTATLAFDGEGRNIAKGASLGLYAGIIFGAYVVTSYEMKKRGWGQGKDEEYYPSSGEYDGASVDFKLEDELYSLKRKQKEGQQSALAFSLPVINWTF